MNNPKGKILLIEDDTSLGGTIEELLELNDFDLRWAKDGHEALLILKNYTPEIIVCDLMMPKLDGEAFFAEVRKNKELDTVPFVMITANIDAEVKMKQLESGVNDFINKPFKIQELIYRIKNLLDYKKSVQNKTDDPFSRVTIQLSRKSFFTRLNEVLLAGINSDFNIEELAKRMGISKSALDKRIRKRKNQNITEYIREFRITYAVKLIEAGETNIKLIADRSGFNSVTYFSTSFKNSKNITPSKFIQQFQK